ncbi:32168_t:CDS:2 [Gigaspora margarita]|uniref:32168_t:CDS:1 n=1 Tax=Gigaspora margarita TaxID=4874 RepID=A0ABN7UIH8_GIGMA|nr:32168_t:CDS:2 [Gigaspora margarita]
MDPLQDVVEAQTDFVDRLKEVNNKGTLENSKKIKMKHEAIQESTESKQISLIPMIESMILSYVRIKTNQFAILEVFLKTRGTKLGCKSKHPNQGAKPERRLKYPNRDRRDPNTTNGGQYSARDRFRDRRKSRERRKNIQKIDTEKLAKKREPTKQGKGCSICSMRVNGTEMLY